MQSSFAFEVKALADDGTFEGYASVYNTEPDSYNDVVDPTAFSKTLSTSKQRPLLFNHRDPIGMVQLTDTSKGLRAQGKLSLGASTAKDVYVLLKDKVISGLSIGYETVKASYVGDVRHLQEVKLWEVSLVTFPAQASAQVTAVKSADIDRFGKQIDQFRKDIKQWKVL